MLNTKAKERGRRFENWDGNAWEEGQVEEVGRRNVSF